MSLNSASVLAAQINLSNITTTNAVKTNDAILVNANLGAGVWATRTATKQAVFGDPFKVTSLLADDSTNVAMVVNSASPWSGGNLLSFRNNGAEKASINYVGGVTKGTKTETIWGALPTEGEFFIGMNDVSNGDGINYAIAHGAFQTNDWSGAYSYFEIGGDTNEFLLSGVTQGESKYYEVHLGSEPDVTGGLRLTLSDIGGNLTRLSPAVASQSTPYLLDTESTRTSRLLDVANNGTNKFSVGPDGSLVGAQSPAEPAAPSAGYFTLFAVDNGSGKMLLKVRFPTGSSQTIATQP